MDLATVRERLRRLADELGRVRKNLDRLKRDVGAVRQDMKNMVSAGTEEAVAGANDRPAEPDKPAARDKKPAEPAHVEVLFK